MSAARAWFMGLGASGSLLLAAVVVFLLGAAFVGFGGWPIGGGSAPVQFVQLPAGAHRAHHAPRRGHPSPGSAGATRRVPRIGTRNSRRPVPAGHQPRAPARVPGSVIPSRPRRTPPEPSPKPRSAPKPASRGDRVHRVVTVVHRVLRTIIATVCHVLGCHSPIRRLGGARLSVPELGQAMFTGKRSSEAQHERGNHSSSGHP